MGYYTILLKLDDKYTNELKLSLFVYLEAV